MVFNEITNCDFILPSKQGHKPQPADVFGEGNCCSLMLCLTTEHVGREIAWLRVLLARLVSVT